MNLATSRAYKPLLLSLLAPALLSTATLAQRPETPKNQFTNPESSVAGAVQRKLHGADMQGKDGPMAKASTSLIELHERFESVSSKAGRRQAAAKTMATLRSDSVAIDAVAEESGQQLRADLRRLGLNQSAVAGRIVSGWLPVSEIPKAASLSSLRSIRPAIARTGVGDVTTQGDAAMRADEARADQNVDGSGVKVGVISDTYNQKYDIGVDDADDDIESGDLPPKSRIQILDDPSISDPIDEGRAMMQIVRDVAPGASQAFHGGFPGIASMVDAIRDLAAANSDVIVDDLGFFAAPFFQDGQIAQVADSVAREGTPYFSAAGNAGQKSYQSEFRGAEIGDSGRTFHDFDPGQNKVFYQEVRIPVGESVNISFQWTDPHAIEGNSAPDSDLDIFLVDDTLGIQQSSKDPNTARPVEIFQFQNDGSVDANEDGFADTRFFVAFELFDGPSPDLVKYIDFNTVLDIREFNTQSATSFGHPNASKVAGVGAARFSETPEFGISPPDVRSFSSKGGTPIYFDDSGNRLSSPVTRQKPDFVAPDGADNTFFGSDTDGDGFPNFAGTSAAAPHAAGVAALMLEENPALTPSQIYSSLEASAIDMDDPATAGFDDGFDFRTGHGLIQADATAPLPVELARFEGTLLQDRERPGETDIRLTWQTVSETNNAGFEVQRRSGEDESWKRVGYQESEAESGTSNQPLAYRFTDRRVPYSVDSVSYRLRQVDTDGTATLTDPIMVGRDGPDELQLLGTAPNPARNQATVQYGVPEQMDGKVRLRLYDVLGRRVQSLETQARNGRHEKTLDVSGLSSGVYVLRLSAGGQSVTRKLTVL